MCTVSLNVIVRSIWLFAGCAGGCSFAACIWRSHGIATGQAHHYLGLGKSGRDGKCPVGQVNRQTRANGQGEWKVTFPAMTSGGPFHTHSGWFQYGDLRGRDDWRGLAVFRPVEHGIWHGQRHQFGGGNRRRRSSRASGCCW